jgi:hypothetical protein
MPIDYDILVKRRCEVCSAIFIEEYGYSLAATWLVTGYHAGIPSYDCSTSHPEGQSRQHWGCSPEHALQALYQCLQGDVMSIETLKAKHDQAAKDGHPRVAPYFQSLYAEKGDTFHIIKKP